MSYYNGVFNSIADLLTNIQSALTTEGYAWVGDDLVLPAGVIRFATSSTRLFLTAADNGAGGTLVNAVPSPVTLGFNYSGNLITFPGSYHIFTFTDPIEVYIVARVNVDYFLFASFGVSDTPALPASGLWLSASAGNSQSSISDRQFSAYTTGAAEGGSNSSLPMAPFWQDSAIVSNQTNCYLRDGYESRVWSYQPLCRCSAAVAINPLLNTAYQPSAFNSQIALLPINVAVARASSFNTIAATLRNARYMRVNYHAPEEIITLGADRWMVLPFYRRNASVHSDSYFRTDHSGTLGWAIRYEGP